MHILIQLSDLHFGSNDPRITEELREAVLGLAPDSIVVCGDLTMRAKAREFEAAAQFLKNFNVPSIVVPGNHDISLYNVFRRFYKPLQKFRNYISDREESHLITPGLAVIGLNSSRSLTIKGGNVSGVQVKAVQNILAMVPDDAIKIVVTHHPLDGVSDRKLHTLVEAGADLFLSGHTHRSDSNIISKKIKDRHHSVLMVQAGTSTSVRYRNEHNSFNTLKFTGAKLTLETYTWDEKEAQFICVRKRHFLHSSDGWATVS